jgi:hypothetical protein
MHDIESKQARWNTRIKLIRVILNEALTVVNVAQRYASELSEIGIHSTELQRMRTLIGTIDAHYHKRKENKTNVVPELRELQFKKEVILKAVELKFGPTSPVLKEFCHPEGEETYVHLNSSS